MKDFINIADFTAAQLSGLIERAIADKAEFRAGRLVQTLTNRTLAMIFEKPSLRTRVSFEAAMTHLGGHAIYLTKADIGLGSREPVEDIARVLGRMCDGIMARTFSHDHVEQLARFSPVPVINALTDYSHPCQAMADAMTLREHFGDLEGRTIAFVGDGNNVARSLATLACKLNMRFTLASPEGYSLPSDFLDRLVATCSHPSCRTTHDPFEAVRDADVVYTDTWTSMGQEDEKTARRQAFAAFQVNDALLAAAPDHAVVMHCLPAYRGSEITDSIMRTHGDIIFAEAENRLHFQRTLLSVLMGEGGIG
ncbi:MAG: ornithine carbamoyltransferase [Planctomycetes bacterium]|nr:ornithine carbamoyltransferase [Planctomycetota bacterium]